MSTHQETIMRLRPVRHSSVPATTFVAWLGIVALSFLFVVAASPSAFAQKHKPTNFAGIPKKLLSEVVGMFSGTLQPGITQQMANDVLLRLVQEEHAAANPGPDVTGFMDAFLAFEDLRAALKRVKNATEAEVPSAVKLLIEAIDNLGHLWTVGPVGEGFYSTDEAEK